MEIRDLMEGSVNSWWRDECMNDRWKGGVTEQTKGAQGKQRSSKREGTTS